MRYALFLVVLSFSHSLRAETGPPAPEAVQAAVEKGLQYLAGKQAKDGSWGRINNVAITAGICMAMMASGSTIDRGPYCEHIRRALDYIMSCQEQHGCIIHRQGMSWAETHSHGYALLCLTQAYGMLPEDRREKMSTVIKKAIAASLKSQSDNGGWGYGILQERFLNGYKDEGSCSITQLQALRACRDIHFDVPEKNIQKAIKYVEKCQHSSGGFLYSLDMQTVGIDPADMSSPTYAVSAAMLSTLNAAGDYHSQCEAKALEYLQKFIDGRKSINVFFYYGNFYAAQAFFQSGEEPWQRYWRTMAPQILKKQSPDGSFVGEGTWESDEQYGSPLLTTAFALLVLQIPNQYLPVFQR